MVPGRPDLAEEGADMEDMSAMAFSGTKAQKAHARRRPWESSV